MTLEKFILNLKWIFFYRGVLVAAPNAGQMLIFDKMHRVVAMHKCAVCKKQYWVVGNPKVKGHFSPVCGRRQCYIAYYSKEGKYYVKTTPIKKIRQKAVC